MRKVILKCRLKNRDEFDEKLVDLDLDFNPMYWLHERIYVPRNYKKSSSFPRLILKTEVRAVDRPAKYVLELRRHIEDSKTDLIDATVIRDYSEAANIVLSLGFEEQKEISLRRLELTMHKDITVYLDKVDNLSGVYLKLECEVKDSESVEAARGRLLKTLVELGQSEKDLVFDTYSEQM